MALSYGMLVISPDIGYEVLGKTVVGANCGVGFIRRDSSVGGICGDYP